MIEKVGPPCSPYRAGRGSVQEVEMVVVNTQYPDVAHYLSLPKENQLSDRGNQMTIIITNSTQ